MAERIRWTPWKEDIERLYLAGMGSEKIYAQLCKDRPGITVPSSSWIRRFVRDRLKIARGKKGARMLLKHGAAAEWKLSEMRRLDAEGIPRQEIAKRLGMTMQTIRNYMGPRERGRHVAGSQVRSLLLRAYELRASEGLSWRKIAAIIDVPPSTLRDWRKWAAKMDREDDEEVAA